MDRARSGVLNQCGNPDGTKTPPHVVQRIARHADLDVTLGIYAHTDLDPMREALDSIEWDDL
ncbi:MAG TPA: hypothetical protein VIY28_16935 [Pseudonocardiaceae bacterium]